MFVYGFEISEHPELNADIIDNMSVDGKRALVADGYDCIYSVNGFFKELNADMVDTENYFYILL